MTTYAERWGKPRIRVAGRDPRKDERRRRAAERLAQHVCSDTCKRFRRAAS